MHFSLAYFSAAFLIFACLTSASPVSADGSSPGPSSGPSTTPATNQYSRGTIVRVRADKVEGLNSAGYLFPGKEETGFFIIQKKGDNGSFFSGLIGKFSKSRSTKIEAPNDDKYYGNFVIDYDIGTTDSNLVFIPYNAWQSKMPNLNRITKATEASPAVILAELVKVKKSAFVEDSIPVPQSLLKDELAPLETLKRKYAQKQLSAHLEDAGFRK